MKKMLFVMLIAGAAALAAPRQAAAQSCPLVVNVPFEFAVGDQVLPAGNYRISTDAHDRTLVRIESIGRKSGGAFAASEALIDTKSGKPGAVFKNVGGRMVLSQVTMGDDAREIMSWKAELERTPMRTPSVPEERHRPSSTK